MAILTLLTDFGTRDYYVGALKGTVLRLAPEARIVDLTHEIAPGDVAGAAYVLGAAAPSFPAGTVHLAVVDPGVGSARRMLALGAAGALFLAPDNGLLTPFLDHGEVRRIERPDLYLEAPGATFHGRDRFAPVAAFVLGGGEPASLGPPIDDPLRLPLEAPMREPELLRGRIVHVDRFGNLVTDIPSSWLPEGPLEARVGVHQTSLRASHYQELAQGEVALFPGSLGTLELAASGEDLAQRWRVGRGAPVEITLGERRARASRGR